MTFGSLLAAMHSYLDNRSAEDPSQHYAENLLRMVGLSTEEAHRVSRLPLPPLPDLPR